MKSIIGCAVGVMALVLGGGISMAAEEAEFELVEAEGAFAVRDYAAHVLAETTVKAARDEAGNKAFRTLFNYISGDNRSRTEVPMTAPVSQKAESERIAMTSPVGQRGSNDTWVVSFMMPAAYTLATLPEPTDQAVTLRQVPARRMAVISYSGTWSSKRFLEHKAKLEAWIKAKSLTVEGPAEWARYDPPFKPWFMRRNEVLIPIGGKLEELKPEVLE
jgi:hypothetical protein